eukprot:Selendium_serpulae@DN3683_c0_g1_i2.p3
MLFLICTAIFVMSCHAPPLKLLLQPLQFQMPTALRFTEAFPHNGHSYFTRWEISTFFTFFRRDAPYLVPYFPTMPTFLVRFAIVQARQGPVKNQCGAKTHSSHVLCVD